jgi:hypothetical protein
MGIGGFPTVEERWNLMLDEVFRLQGRNLDEPRRMICLSGYLGGASMIMKVLRDLTKLSDADGEKILHSINYELDLLMRELELTSIQSLIKGAEDEY